jgi:preprotein translocase subunit SecF
MQENSKTARKNNRKNTGKKRQKKQQKKLKKNTEQQQQQRKNTKVSPRGARTELSKMLAEKHTMKHRKFFFLQHPTRVE